MRLADFQGPLASTPHVQNLQQAGQQPLHAQPAVFAQELTRQDVQQDTTVRQPEQQAQINPVRQDAERGARRRRLPRRRAAPNKGRPPIPTAPAPAPKDGIHGLHIDVEA